MIRFTYPPGQELFFAFSIALAIVFVAICVSIYYTHRRDKVLKALEQKLTVLLQKHEESK